MHPTVAKGKDESPAQTLTTSKFHLTPTICNHNKPKHNYF